MHTRSLLDPKAYGRVYARRSPTHPIVPGISKLSKLCVAAIPMLLRNDCRITGQSSGSRVVLQTENGAGVSVRYAHLTVFID